MITNMIIGPVIGSVSIGSNVNPEPIVPDGAILTEDGLFYLLTEDGLYYIKQEEA